MFCPKCGSELEDGAIFCGKCGSKLDERAQAETENKAKETPSIKNVDDLKKEIGTRASAGAAKSVSSAQNALVKMGTKKAMIVGAIAAVVIIILIIVGIRSCSPAPGSSPEGGEATPEAATEQQAASAAQQNVQTDYSWQDYYVEPFTELGVYDTVTYSDFISGCVTEYPTIPPTMIKTVVTEDVYHKLIGLEFIEGLAKEESEEAAASVSAALDAEYEALNTQLQSMAQTNPVQLNNLKTDIVCTEEGTYRIAVTGEVENTTDLEIYRTTISSYVRYRLAPEKDKYGDEIPRDPIEKYMYPTNEDLYGKGFSVESDRAFADPMLCVFDLAAHEKRSFTYYLNVGDYISYSDEDDNIEAIEEVAIAPASLWFVDSVQDNEDVADVQIAQGIQLDTDTNEYHAYNGQIEVALNSIEVDEEGNLASINVTATNNTGFYVSNCNVHYMLLKKGTLPGSADAGDAYLGGNAWGVVSGYFTDDRDNGGGVDLGVMKPGDSVQLSTETESSDLWLEEFSGTVKPGAYTPSELGVECYLAFCRYDLDVEKNIDMGLLPEDWKDRSTAEKNFRATTASLLQMAGELIETAAGFIEEHPYEALDIADELLQGHPSDAVAIGLQTWIEDSMQ